MVAWRGWLQFLLERIIFESHWSALSIFFSINQTFTPIVLSTVLRYVKILKSPPPSSIKPRTVHKRVGDRERYLCIGTRYSSDRAARAFAVRSTAIPPASQAVFPLGLWTRLSSNNNDTHVSVSGREIVGLGTDSLRAVRMSIYLYILRTPSIRVLNFHSGFCTNADRPVAAPNRPARVVLFSFAVTYNVILYVYIGARCLRNTADGRGDEEVGIRVMFYYYYTCVRVSPSVETRNETSLTCKMFTVQNHRVLSSADRVDGFEIPRRNVTQTSRQCSFVSWNAVAGGAAPVRCCLRMCEHFSTPNL